MSGLPRRTLERRRRSHAQGRVGTGRRTSSSIRMAGNGHTAEAMSIDLRCARAASACPGPYGAIHAHLSCAPGGGGGVDTARRAVRGAGWVRSAAHQQCVGGARLVHREGEVEGPADRVPSLVAVVHLHQAQRRPLDRARDQAPRLEPGLLRRFLPLPQPHLHARPARHAWRTHSEGGTRSSKKFGTQCGG